MPSVVRIHHPTPSPEIIGFQWFQGFFFTILHSQKQSILIIKNQINDVIYDVRKSGARRPRFYHRYSHFSLIRAGKRTKSGVEAPDKIIYAYF